MRIFSLCLLSLFLFPSPALARSSLYFDLNDVPVRTESVQEDETEIAPEEDPCEAQNLYGDGICHTNCLEPDPDCDDEEDFCEQDDLYDDGYCDMDCPKPDPDCDLEECTEEKPIRCPHGTCVSSQEECFPSLPSAQDETCPEDAPVRCPNGQCARSVQLCFPSDVTSVEEELPKVEQKEEAASSKEPPAEAALPEEAEEEPSDGMLDVAEMVRKVVVREEDLQELRDKILDENQNITKLTIEEETVTVEYRRTAKLLGFIPVPYMLTVTAQGAQLVSKSPWWLFLAADDAKSTVGDIQALLEEDPLVGGALTDRRSKLKRIMEIFAETLQ